MLKNAVYINVKAFRRKINFEKLSIFGFSANNLNELVETGDIFRLRFS